MERSVAPAGRARSSGKTPVPAMLLCPYCGSPTPPGSRCAACRGLLDPLSRQASQNAMGPWFVRDEASPFMPGCSYDTMVGMVKRGKISKRTVLRGPTTRQFWCTAERTPGVSHLLGVCHNCRVDVQPTDSFCDECGAGFTVEPDRQHLGLGEVHVIPGQAAPHVGVREAAREPEVAEPVAAAPGVNAVDFTPLIVSLRGKVRRQRWMIAILLLCGVAGVALAAWRFVPADVWQSILGGSVRFGGPSPAVPQPVKEQPAPPAAQIEIPLVKPEPAPPTVPTVLMPEPAAPDFRVEVPAPTPAEPAPEPKGGEVEGAADAGVLTTLAGLTEVEAITKAAGERGASPALQKALVRRAVQVGLRSFP